MRNKKCRVFAVCGGKGGVGKTNIATNVAVALANLNARVCLVDMDLELANIHVLTGLRPKLTLENVVNEGISFEDVMIELQKNMYIVPSCSGSRSLANVNTNNIRDMLHHINDIKEKFDYIIIDTAAGISEYTMSIIQGCDDVYMVICNNPASIIDAYTQIKILHEKYQRNHFKIIVNRLKTNADSNLIFNKLNNVAEKFLDAVLLYDGGIPEDRMLEKAVCQSKPVAMKYMNSKSSNAFMQIAKKIIDQDIVNKSKLNNFNTKIFPVAED